MTRSNEITSADGGWRGLFASEDQWSAAAEFLRSAMNSIRNRSKLLATASFGGVLLCLAGCYFGDPIAQRTVSLGFPVADQQTNATLSATNAEVQEALRIIDGVMVGEGFVRDQNPLAAEDRAQGIIATYGRYTVLLRDHTLTVNFVEFGKRHSSPVVKRTCGELKEKLGKRFGDKRVREDTGSAGMQVSLRLSSPPNQRVEPTGGQPLSSVCIRSSLAAGPRGSRWLLAGICMSPDRRFFAFLKRKEPHQFGLFIGLVRIGTVALIFIALVSGLGDVLDFRSKWMFDGPNSYPLSKFVWRESILLLHILIAARLFALSLRKY